MPAILGPLTLLDLAFVAGVAAVLPLSLGGPYRWWLVATVSALAALWQPVGEPLGIVLSLPVMAVVLSRGAIAVPRIRVPTTITEGGRLVAHGHAVVAAAWLLISCAGWRLVGVREPIVELTAIHFTYAGVGALVLAATVARPASRLGTVAVAMTATAPTIVALGFTTGAAIAQVGGAVLMSLGVWCTALALLARAAQPGARARGLLVLSGLAVWVPMVLAVSWAAAQHWSVPALSVPDMARTHGIVNGVGFVIAGLVATAADRRSATWS